MRYMLHWTLRSEPRKKTQEKGDPVRKEGKPCLLVERCPKATALPTGLGSTPSGLAEPAAPGTVFARK